MLALPLAACALPALPVDDVLGRAATEAATGSASLPAPEATALQKEVDLRAAQSVAMARRAPADPVLALAAAARLFQAADLRLQRASLAALAASPRAAIETVLSAEDAVPEAVRAEILALCRSGLELAERAQRLHPEDPAACLHVALHLSLIAWANGAVRTLLAGDGPRLGQAIERAVQLDACYDHAAPLRLQGRFLSRAPWPYGDRPRARAALERATKCADLSIHHLFFGDALFAAGERDAALAQWRLAVTAPADEATRYSTPFLRELSGRRVAALVAERQDG